MKAARILLVDDDKDLLQFLARLLQSAGDTVLTAQDPIQAVMRAQRQAPDLILTDITMPAGGGFGVLERSTTSSKSNALSIIVPTGTDDPEVEARALAAGVTRVLKKPCDKAVLLESIKTALGEGG